MRKFSESALGAPRRRGVQSTDPLKLLAYGLPPIKGPRHAHISSDKECVYQEAPLGTHTSFLEFDAVVLFAGAFEERKEVLGRHELVTVSPADLDLREREFYSAIEQGTTIVFLVPGIPGPLSAEVSDPNGDLFRRIVREYDFRCAHQTRANPNVQCLIRNFDDYVRQFGAGYVTFRYEGEEQLDVKSIRVAGKDIYGLALNSQVFFLPCASPQTEEQLSRMVASALQCALSYRSGLLELRPEWAVEFQFSREAEIRDQLADIRAIASQLDSQLGCYDKAKELLFCQSSSLVEKVRDFLSERFDLKLSIDVKCIEDATIRDDQGIHGVVEIKGVKKNFSRQHINQVDSHRERLGLDPSTPGILIVNTIMDAASLKDKDQHPHPDIIKKAVADNVLLVRTLDLLRFADGVEAQQFKKHDFKPLLLRNSGWLQVEGGAVTIDKGV